MTSVTPAAPGHPRHRSEGPSARAWREALASWAIPPSILELAPESPWYFPVELFASRADAAARSSTPSTRRALEALPEGGSVLDVGCGAGAASLALASRAAHLVGVDSSPDMLEAFAARTASAGLRGTAVLGPWPDVAAEVPPADVVVCHHVAYNAPELDEFAIRLGDHALRRVVVELTLEHPQSRLNPLWLRFHGLDRPSRPTADDALAVLAEVGLTPRTEVWTAHRAGGFARREDLVAWVRRQLCLPASQDHEVGEAIDDWVRELDGRVGLPDRPVMTIWWDVL